MAAVFSGYMNQSWTIPEQLQCMKTFSVTSPDPPISGSVSGWHRKQSPVKMPLSQCWGTALDLGCLNSTLAWRLWIWQVWGEWEQMAVPGVTPCNCWSIRNQEAIPPCPFLGLRVCLLRKIPMSFFWSICCSEKLAQCQGEEIKRASAFLQRASGQSLWALMRLTVIAVILPASPIQRQDLKRCCEWERRIMTAVVTTCVRSLTPHCPVNDPDIRLATTRWAEHPHSHFTGKEIQFQRDEGTHQKSVKLGFKKKPDPAKRH